MKRMLSFARYLPAVLCGLLLVAWVVSGFAVFGVRFHSLTGPGSTDAEVVLGSVKWRHSPHIETTFHPTLSRLRGERIRPAEYLGHFGYGTLDLRSVATSSAVVSYLSLPIPALLTCLLPLALGCLNGFRFPLWSWFAFTALLAAQLVFYLR